MIRPLHIINVSGGKDSAACYRLAMLRGVPFRAVMADTGHESEMTMGYAIRLSAETGGPPVEMVRYDFAEKLAKRREFVAAKWADQGIPQSRVDRALEVLQPTGIPYLDLCLWKGRFPSIRAQFCTEWLKSAPIDEQIIRPALERGPVIQWHGVRRDESRNRARIVHRAQAVRGYAKGLRIFRPILHWTAENVFAFLRATGTPINPLYTEGMARVGCFPCIHSGKQELRAIATRYPEAFEKLREWELLVSEASKRGAATFFGPDTTPDGAAMARAGAKGGVDGAEYPDALKVAAWSKTKRGGRVLAEVEDENSCSSLYGLCE